MPNLYADVDAFRRNVMNNATLDASDATEAERRLEASSRQCDDYCNRPFYPLTQTRVFDGDGYDAMDIPDLIAASSVKLDEEEDGAFGLTLTTADYVLERPGTSHVDGTPKTRIRLLRNGQRGYFLRQPRLLEITGRWGYGEDTEVVRDAAGALVSATLSIGGNTMSTNLDTSTLLAVGQTILLDAEQVYLAKNLAPTSWLVGWPRPVNGSTQAVHSAAQVNRYVYTPQVRDATLIQAAALWKGRETPYVVNPLTGQAVEASGRGLHPDARALLHSLRRNTLVVA